MPIPSPRLLRFLRLQSENLSFFSPNNGPSTRLRCSARKAALCAAKRLSDSYLGMNSRQSQNDHLHLQSSVFDLECLSQSRALRAPRNLRSGRPALFMTALGTRYSSSDQPPADCKRTTWAERLWGPGARSNSASTLKPGDVPNHDADGQNNSMFNNRRPLSGKAALEPELLCTAIDEDGRVISVQEKMKKSELTQQFGLQPRDLRKIDASNLPHILVRNHAILLNMLHLKVLITSNKVLIFDMITTKPQAEFIAELRRKLEQKTNELPYEFSVLESVLQSITGLLDKDFNNIYDPVIQLLRDLENDVDREKLRRLLIFSKRVITFQRKAELVRRAIWDLLNNDEDLAAMYLTEKSRNIIREEDDHTEIELLLESYHKFSEEIYQEATNLVSSIGQTEEISRAILDANRNQLMVLDLKFNVATLSFAMGTFIAGLYGMNLENFIEESHWGFGAVTGLSMILSVWVFMYGTKKLRGLQRVRMGDDDRATLYYHLERNGASRHDDKRHQHAAHLKKRWWRFWWRGHR